MRTTVRSPIEVGEGGIFKWDASRKQISACVQQVQFGNMKHEWQTCPPLCFNTSKAVC